MARLVFVNRFYWPETPATGQLLTDLAEELAARGHEIDVVTSRGESEIPAQEINCGVRITRVRGTRAGASPGIAGKALDFATFYLAAVWRVARIARRGTVLIAMTDPPLLGIGIGLVARARGCRLVHWVQDIYPELAMELTGAGWVRMIRPWRNHAWRDAEHCVTLGRDMAQTLARAGVPSSRITIISNWGPRGVDHLSPESTSPLRVAWNLTGKFVVAYAGNLGRVHDLYPILNVAERLLGDPSIAFVFIGDGALRGALEAEATRRRLTNVSFRPPQPRDRLSETLALGDVHWVTLLPDCESLVFPSKLHGIAAAGRPVLFIGPSHCEIANIIQREQLGYTGTRDETERLAALVQSLSRDPATCASFRASATRFAAQHCAAAAAQQWHDLLGALEACWGPRPVPMSRPSA